MSMKDEVIGKLSEPDKAMIAQFNIEGVRIGLFETGGAYFLFQLKKDGNSIIPNGFELEPAEAKHVAGFMVGLRKFVRHCKPLVRKKKRGK